MVRSIEFKSVRNISHSTLTEDLNNIKFSRNLLVFAEMPPDQHETLLNNNITKMYRKADSNAKRNID